MAPVAPCHESKCAPSRNDLAGAIGSRNFADDIEAGGGGLSSDTFAFTFKLDLHRHLVFQQPDHPVVVLDGQRDLRDAPLLPSTSPKASSCSKAACRRRCAAAPTRGRCLRPTDRCWDRDRTTPRRPRRGRTGFSHFFFLKKKRGEGRAVQSDHWLPTQPPRAAPAATSPRSLPLAVLVAVAQHHAVAGPQRPHGTGRLEQDDLASQRAAITREVGVGLDEAAGRRRP